MVPVCRLNKAKLEKNEDLLTNPSLGLGISELTAALRQQRPRRAVATLPVVESDSSMHGGVASTPRASDSPGMTSPFAALAHSPPVHDEAVLADSVTPAAEEVQQPPYHLQNDTQPASAASWPHQQPAVQSSEHDGDDANVTCHPQRLDTAPHADDVETQGRETESDLQSNSSSDSRQRFRRRGRSKCTVM